MEFLKSRTAMIVSLLAIVISTGYAERTTTSPFDGILEDVASCKGDCAGTYPLHTYPEVRFYLVESITFVEHLASIRPYTKYYAVVLLSYIVLVRTTITFRSVSIL